MIKFNDENIILNFEDDSKYKVFLHKAKTREEFKWLILEAFQKGKYDNMLPTGDYTHVNQRERAIKNIIYNHHFISGNLFKNTGGNLIEDTGSLQLHLEKCTNFILVILDHLTYRYIVWRYDHTKEQKQWLCEIINYVYWQEPEWNELLGYLS